MTKNEYKSLSYLILISICFPAFFQLEKYLCSKPQGLSQFCNVVNEKNSTRRGHADEMILFFWKNNLCVLSILLRTDFSDFVEINSPSPLSFAVKISKHTVIKHARII